MNLFISDMCTLLNRDAYQFHFKVEDRFDDYKVEVDTTPSQLSFSCSCNSDDRICSHAATALIYLADKFQEESPVQNVDGDVYTREEMKLRVLKERHERAVKEDFQIEIGDNIYGDHRIQTASGKSYRITVRNFDSQGGYCSCPDYKTNKLGTCKHIIFAVRFLWETYDVKKQLKKQHYPFVEIYGDPLSEYRITYYHKGPLDPPVKALLDKYFAQSHYILPEHYPSFINFLTEAREYKKILVRPEVEEKIEAHFEALQLQKLGREYVPDFSRIKGDLYPYQKEGVLFSLFKKGNIIADEMGLGKTFQAICTAVLKKDIFNFKRVLVICPASLKSQWKNEIRRFSNYEAQIVEGPRQQRQDIYRKSKEYFLLANYEAILRDITIIQKYPPDMIILDEAQRIKNYDTKTSQAVKAIPKQHALVITGTPIENKLIDLYSIMNFVDPLYLAPLWEFSMNHCRFDKEYKNKINSYYNLQELKTRLQDKIIRREKKDVMEQLPAIQEMVVPVQLSLEQVEIHAGFAKSLAPIFAKKHKTIYDIQRIFRILTSMRMVCDSTYLIDKETHISPKLDALKEILTEKLDIKNTRKKILIFSEWKIMLHLIEKMLQSQDIPYTKLTGDIAMKDRDVLIGEFMENPDCLVFLSTEAGGTGLNLQAADTIINFELPWNPAKKNQRIGRIHRIGQKSSSLTVINLIALESIEVRIAAGIQLKESMFQAVLNEGDLTDEVDFAKKGIPTIIQQIEKMIQPFLGAPLTEKEIEPAVAEEEIFDLPQFSDEITPELSLFAEEEFLATDEPQTTVTSKEAEKVADSPNTVTITTPEPPVVPSPERKAESAPRVPKPEEIENTLNQGLQFLSGIMSMATGKQLITQGQSITIDHETGEVVMKFKLPGF